jgi:large subunit ribosomal protein L15
MTLAPHTIHAGKGSRKGTRRLGRGHGTGRGTSAGRGTKGQRARTGGRSGTALRPLKRELLRVPKLRGFRSMFPRPAVVTLKTLERICVENDTVTPEFLASKGVIRDTKKAVKILSSGVLNKKINLQGCLASKGAIAAIEKTGGSVTF